MRQTEKQTANEKKEETVTIKEREASQKWGEEQRTLTEANVAEQSAARWESSERVIPRCEGLIKLIHFYSSCKMFVWRALGNAGSRLLILPSRTVTNCKTQTRYCGSSHMCLIHHSSICMITAP